jgi:hypothetical protein
MASIDPTSRMLSYLREQAQEWRRQVPASGVPSKRAGDAGQTRPDRMKLAAQAISAIDPQDPDSPRKAFRLYLEGLLARELGASSAQPGFAGLVERVHATMEADPELKQAMEQAGALLLKGGPAAA